MLITLKMTHNQHYVNSLKPIHMIMDMLNLLDSASLRLLRSYSE